LLSVMVSAIVPLDVIGEPVTPDVKMPGTVSV
jgi:hypothetical protein